MKFKQFITETELDLVSKCEIIKSKCSQFLNEAGNLPAYRGQKHSSFENNTYAYRTVKDLRTDSTNLYNFYVEEKFNIEKVRNKHTAFANGYFKEANAYGEIFFFFPENDYHYVWSPLIRDFLTIEDTIWNRIYKELIIKFDKLDDNTNKKILKFVFGNEADKIMTIFKDELLKKANLSINDVKNYTEKTLNNKTIYEIVKPIMMEIFDDYDFKNTDLKEALNSGVELIFTTKKYFLISIYEVDIYFKLDSIIINNDYKSQIQAYEERYKKLLGLLK